MSTKFKSPGTPPKGIKARNRWFHKLSKPQQRVAIAEDALLQLKLNKYVAESGIYFSAKDKDGFIIYDTKDAQETIDVADECYVCARGAVFASRCRLGNDGLSPCWLKRTQSGTAPATNFYAQEAKVVDPIFGRLGGVMEVLFELSCFAADIRSDKEAAAVTRCVKTHISKSNRQRMTIIMKNLVKNEGDLVLYGTRFRP